MARQPRSSKWSMVLAAAALGAAVMYMLDPDRGRRRRAIGRDKVRRFMGDARSFAGATARDARHRLRGVRVAVRRRLRPEDTPDDLVLIERARATLGRVVSHPHAIQIGANAGRIMVSGPILAAEVEPLLEAIRAVPGVSAVDDHLVAHERPESVPSLQGGVPHEARAKEHWTPALRAAAIVGGGLLALYGVRSRSLPGAILTAVGIGLGARGATDRPIERLASLETEDPAMPSRTPSSDERRGAAAG